MSVLNKLPVTRDELDRLYERMRDLEIKVSRLQREAVYIEDESPEEWEFRVLDQRPRIHLKALVLDLIASLGMNIKVEPAKSPSAKLTRKLDWPYQREQSVTKEPKE